MQGTLRHTRSRVALITTAITTLLVGIGVVTATSASAATGCQVDYSVQHEWPGGFTAEVGITNLGDPINGWELVWTYPSGQQVSHYWNANLSSAGSEVTATNVSYNPVIGTNATVSFGLIGSFSGSNQDPTTFTLNGVTCTGEVGETTPPPTIPPPTTTPPPGDQDAMEAVEAMQPGWNLGNSLDAVGPDETAWGNPLITQALIQNVQAQGFNSIRIPVTWTQHTGPAPEYTIDPQRLDRVQEVVDWALAEDLWVMINIHHDSWQWIAQMPNDHTNVLNRYNSIWTQVADRFRDYPPELVFESVNEPQFENSSDTQSAQLLRELNTSFHDIIRGSGGTNASRLLVLPTLHTSTDQVHIDELNTTIGILDDPNLIATVHYYGFWPFSVNVAGFTTFDAEVRQDLIDAFDRVHDSFVAQGIPVIVGEYGLLGFDAHVGTVQQGEKLKFFEFLGHYANERNLTTQIWDNGQHFHRTSFQWNDPELFAQVESSWTTRSGTASSDQVFVERSSTITDHALTLNLNGTSFEGLREGNTSLVEGSDYTVSGDQLTITASLLTDLVGSQQYGANAVLHAEFSAGIPWRISIVSYDQPILQDASGSTTSFEIPTQFRGDQLATMEAVYVDGGFAGPHDWTPFKEFSRAFEPDYDGDAIRLTSDFFDGVDDNREAILTFHFWSGETVEYSITRSAGSVTGSV